MNNVLEIVRSSIEKAIDDIHEGKGDVVTGCSKTAVS